MCPGIMPSCMSFSDGGVSRVQDYRRRLNRAERRKAEKAGDGSGAALREAAEEAEFERAKVLLQLRSSVFRQPLSAVSSSDVVTSARLSNNHEPGFVSCCAQASRVLPSRLPAELAAVRCRSG